MRQTRKLAVGVVVCLGLLIPLQAGAAGWLVGAAADGTIYDVDMVTGAAGNPRSTGIAHLQGIAFAGDDTLYGLSADGPLFTIDLGTGAAINTGAHIGSSTRHDLAWDPIVESLFYLTTAPGASGTRLTMFNPASEEETHIGMFANTTSSIAFDNTGALFAIDDISLLLTVDTTPRPPDDFHLEILTEISLSTDLFYPRGLAVVTMDAFYVSGTDADGVDSLYALESTTGLLTLVGPTGVPGGLTDLAVVPELASLLLLGVGAACVARRRQRKSKATGFDLEETV